jgi:DNA-binding transcriptional regulator of glucitol operon
LEILAVAKENEKGQITVEQKKKKREIFEESGHRVDVPPDVSEEDKKALKQTGEDATAGW